MHVNENGLLFQAPALMSSFGVFVGFPYPKQTIGRALVYQRCHLLRTAMLGGSKSMVVHF